jgi:hypothetical protein
VQIVGRVRLTAAELPHEERSREIFDVALHVALERADVEAMDVPHLCGARSSFQALCHRSLLGRCPSGTLPRSRGGPARAPARVSGPGRGGHEDYQHTTAAGRDRLLLASAKHTAGHRKYGDHLEAYRRFAEALDLTDR